MKANKVEKAIEVLKGVIKDLEHADKVLNIKSNNDEIISSIIGQKDNVTKVFDPPEVQEDLFWICGCLSMEPQGEIRPVTMSYCEHCGVTQGGSYGPATVDGIVDEAIATFIRASFPDNN